jgi:formate--tetrahydrofolate ligase
MAQKLCDYTVVEAGFGSDLGAEKFVDIVSRVGEFNIDASVLVATIRALKFHGGAPKKDPQAGNIEQLKEGLLNLSKHLENLHTFRIPPVVALNVFEGDTDEEIRIVKDFCKGHDAECAEVQAFATGAEGAVELAELVCQAIDKGVCCVTPVYDMEDDLVVKVEKVATRIYGAARVVYTPKADKDIKRIQQLGFGNLPVCIAKTNMSLSDNPALLGRPENFKITISKINISAGAGFLVPLTGEVMLMPGLSKIPNATRIDIDEQGRVTGLS